MFFLCLLPAGAFRSQIRYVKFNLAIFHISSACNSKLFSISEQNSKVWTVIYSHAKFENAAPVIIEMFNQPPPLKCHHFTTGGVPSFCLIESQKCGLQKFLL